MARFPRFVLPGHPQHVIIRGNNRQAIFYVDEDYDYFLEKLHLACQKWQCEVHAYVLMTNHVHLLITPLTEHGISKVMQSVGRYYVQYFNYRYKRTGTLWEGRYKATLIDMQTYLLSCYRYIELNPVRAEGMAEHPSEYPWSSYRHNALGDDNEMVIPHSEYLKLGGSSVERQAAYRQLFNSVIPEQTLEDIRVYTNKAWVLGSDYFKQQVACRVMRQVAGRVRGGDRRSKAFNESRFNRL